MSVSSESRRQQAEELGLIEKEPGAAEWRVLRTGMQVDFDSIFGEEVPEAELMSFTDWVIALSPCFDPMHKGPQHELSSGNGSRHPRWRQPSKARRLPQQQPCPSGNSRSSPRQQAAELGLIE